MLYPHASMLSGREQEMQAVAIWVGAELYIDDVYRLSYNSRVYHTDNYEMVGLQQACAASRRVGHLLIETRPKPFQRSVPTPASWGKKVANASLPTRCSIPHRSHTAQRGRKWGRTPSWAKESTNSTPTSNARQCSFPRRPHSRRTRPVGHEKR